MENPLKPLVYDLTLKDWQFTLASWGEPSFRALQIWQGLYQHWWETPEGFTNLPAALRTRLAEQFTFSNLAPDTVLQSKGCVDAL
jgi:23S rRNA (adenine2503-C2)-methyltransferase